MSKPSQPRPDIRFVDDKSVLPHKWEPFAGASARCKHCPFHRDDSVHTQLSQPVAGKHEQYAVCPRCGGRIYNAQTEWRHEANRSPTCPAYEAHQVAPSPPQTATLKQIIGDLAKEIYHNATNSRSELERLLLQFAQEIRRGAIEP